ncbi:MAG: SPOR domain-containing protein [Bacteroidales bacterium]|nr:SPOR domain-containing protein [Bacteroidales bacterium]
MDIDRYIKELIILSECIILPDFGGFLTKYRSSTFDKKRKIISPPSKEVLFKEDLKRDNGLLVDYISKNENIGIRKARILVEQYIDEKNAAMQKGEKVLIRGIGWFYMDKFDKIQFIPDSTENLLADAYGLEEFSLEGMAHENSISEPVPILPIESIKRKRTGLWVIGSIIVIIFIIGILILLVPQINNSSGNGSNTLFSSGSKKNHDKIVFGQRRIIPPDSIQVKIARQIDDRTDKQKALFYTDSLVEAPNREIPATQMYFIVAGSFKNIQNARKKQQALESEGFKSEVIYTNDNFYRVVLSTFSDKSQAIDELRRIRKGLNYTVWVMSQD